mgnify:CR=1 FL=1
MANDTLDARGSVGVTGQLTGFIVRGGPGGGTVERFDPTGPKYPAPGAAVRKAPRWWRLKNGLRKILYGEAFVPLVVGAVKLCRSRAVRSVPVLGNLIAGSFGALGLAVGELRGFVTHADGSVTDYGVLGYHLVVTAGKNFIASTFDNTAEPETLKFHGFGTGATAAAVTDTALQTELTTQYAVANTRPTGSQSHATNVYTTAATLSPSTTVAITEWGLLTQASNAGGTLLDHQIFASVGLSSVDSFTVSYAFSIN